MVEQFGAASTTDEVLSGIDLSGKRYLVTGVSSGMGVETARALAAHGAEVVGAARDLGNAEQATGGGFAVIEVDLAALGQRVACELGTAGEAFSLKTLPQVAATSVWAAAVAEAEAIGGKYCQDCRIAPIDNTPGLRFGVMSHALDPRRAELLWSRSEDLAGEAFRPRRLILGIDRRQPVETAWS